VKDVRRRRQYGGWLPAAGVAWASVALALQACGTSSTDGADGSDAGGGASTGGASQGGSGGSNGTGGSSGSLGGGGEGPPDGVPGTVGYDCSSPSGSAPVLQATDLGVDGLTEPIFLTHEPDGDSGRLFVLERSGRIRIIEDSALHEEPFLDISSKVVVEGGEYGLLGLAFAPDYESSGLFYVHYSDRTEEGDVGDSIIEEYRVTSDRDVADPASARLVLHVEQPEEHGNHKGGSIAFGGDELLYIALGDGGGSGDPEGHAQRLDVLLGKLLRIDPRADGANAYTVPAGNLKDTVPAAAPEIWDYGLRNPFRFTFDGCTGDLYIGDVGQGQWEEVDIELAGDGGKNYGWNVLEGSHCYEPSSGCVETGLTSPALEYDHDLGRSITGGAVYRGSAIPGIRGSYVYADYADNQVWMTAYDRTQRAVTMPVTLTQDLNNMTDIVSITNGSDGELYFVSLAGSVYRLESAP
jgi:glucose/arabinose dehydrogenase